MTWEIVLAVASPVITMLGTILALKSDTAWIKEILTAHLAEDNERFNNINGYLMRRKDDHER